MGAGREGEGGGCLGRFDTDTNVCVGVKFLALVTNALQTFFFSSIYLFFFVCMIITSIESLIP